MNSDDKRQPRSLRELEMEVLEEGREWMRQRLEQKLQQETIRQGGVFPPQQPSSLPSAKARHDSAKRRRAGEA